MTQTIEQLTARVRELEEENARLKRTNSSYANLTKAQESQLTNLRQRLYQLKGADSAIDSERQANCDLTEQLAAEQLNNKLLREALEFLNARIVTMDLGGVVERALSIPASTEAFDKYVAEKVKKATATQKEYYEGVFQDGSKQIAKAFRRRDLAVEALEDVRKELQQSNDRLNEEREIWDRVMGDGVKKLERLELELDDCLYVLESLWDKTCNKEVTEKWAGILIRNKRGIGASSAEDSSEPTSSE